ncbi:hypothetical protein GCM10027192_24040 [Psychrobacter pocilloporae]
MSSAELSLKSTALRTRIAIFITALFYTGLHFVRGKQTAKISAVDYAKTIKLLDECCYGQNKRAVDDAGCAP